MWTISSRNSGTISFSGFFWILPLSTYSSGNSGAISFSSFFLDSAYSARLDIYNLIVFCSRTEGDILPEFLELCVLAFLSYLACGGDVVSDFLRHCIFVGFRLIFAVLGHSSKLSATIFWVLCFLSDLGKVLCLNCSFSRRSFNFQELGFNGVKKHGNTALFFVTFLLPLPGDFSGNVLPSAVWICIPVLHL